MKSISRLFVVFLFSLWVLGFSSVQGGSSAFESGGEPIPRDDLSTERQALLEKIEKKLEEKKEDLFGVYKDLHRHPEISGQEERTAGVIAGRLRALGLEVEEGIGGFGVVGVLRGAKEGPVVAYRADMDAVPDSSPDPVAFKSETPGVRHICGHDAHVTIALGIAEAMASISEELQGTVKFIFQPAEENATGARAMIEAGVLENPSPRAIVAVHCAPLETGRITASQGLMLAGFDLATVTLTGEGDLKVAAQATAKLISGLSSGDLAPPQAYLENSGAGQESAANDFTFALLAGIDERPEESTVVLMGLIRASSDNNFARAKASLTSALAELSIPEVSYSLDYVDRAVPAVMNDPELVKQGAEAIKAILGEEGFLDMGRVPPYFSEDFAHYLQDVPGALYFLGVSNTEKGITGMPHSPGFAVDLDAILIGAKTMAAVLLEHLERLR